MELWFLQRGCPEIFFRRLFGLQLQWPGLLVDVLLWRSSNLWLIWKHRHANIHQHALMNANLNSAASREATRSCYLIRAASSGDNMQIPWQAAGVAFCDMCWKMREASTTQSTLYTLHSTLYNWHIALYTLHSTLYTPHSTLHALHSTLSRIPKSTVHWHGNRGKMYTPQITCFTEVHSGSWAASCFRKVLALCISRKKHYVQRKGTILII